MQAGLCVGSRSRLLLWRSGCAGGCSMAVWFHGPRRPWCCAAGAPGVTEARIGPLEVLVYSRRTRCNRCRVFLDAVSVEVFSQVRIRCNSFEMFLEYLLFPFGFCVHLLLGLLSCCNIPYFTGTSFVAFADFIIAYISAIDFS